MKKTAAVFCVFFSFTVAASAQTAARTVTNKDLEGFSQKRLEAEKEYRSTYAQKGMPSPDELNALGEARIKAATDYLEKVRAEEAERERLALAALQQQQTAPNVYINTYSPGYSGGVVYSYGFGERRFSRGIGHRGFRPPVAIGYAAGGVIWPPPVGTHLPTVRTGPVLRRPVGRSPRR